MLCFRGGQKLNSLDPALVPRSSMEQQAGLLCLWGQTNEELHGSSTHE